MTGRCLGGILCGLIISASGLADTIESATWQPFPTLAEDATPYWDNRSQDGSQKNIGYFLTGLSGYPNSPGLTNPQYLGSGGSTAPSSIIFNSTGPNLLTVLLKATSNGLEFGYFNAASPVDTRALFTTATAVGTQLTFTSEFARYGYYIHYLPNQGPLIPNDFYKSVATASVGTEINALGGVHQHFTVFEGIGGAGAGSYVVGAEDRWGVVNPPGSLSVEELQGDYQDFVVGIAAVAIPEPATMALMAFGLGAAILYARRRR